MFSRRAFLRRTGAFGTAALAFKSHGLDAVLAAGASVAGQSPADVAKDELYWGQIQMQFPLDRQVINLNSGNHCSHPNVVMDAYKRYLDMQNMAPVWYQGQMRGNMETVRRGLAAEFGCDVEEMAITRNASEANETMIFGL
ncbi:MAG TPA: hypothetical protein VFO31_17065, partial [Vicinamibacterales bacterium]|nr:hypothetical protein [Vicinamibacterales bacterium]